VLTSKTVNESMASVLEALRESDADEAMKKIDEISPGVNTERERGVLAAAHGIATSMSRAKMGALQTWDQEKIVRAAEAIRSSQMSDEFDYGFAETLLSYARLLPGKS
jgi:hypothetical protein